MRIGMLALLSVGAVVLPAEAAAQEGAFRLSGHSRARYEALGGQPRTGISATDEQLAIRNLVLLEADPAGPFDLTVQLQDSRAYLTRIGGAVSTNDVNALEINQAFVRADLGAALGKGSRTRVQAGRFLIEIGSRRLVAADDYRNTANSFTGVRADLNSPALTATAFYVLPQTRLPESQAELIDNKVQIDRETVRTQFWMLYLSRPKAIGTMIAEIGYFGFSERDGTGRQTRDRRLHTVDARLIRNPAPGKADVELEAMYQFGSTRTGLGAAAPQADVSAWFVHADAGYTFAGAWKPRLSIEFDRASGDRAGGRYGRFDTLFGMRRADLGPAGIYAAIGRANISTIGARLEAVPSARVDLLATYRAMWTADRTDAFSTTGVRDATGRSGSFAGHQIDTRLRWWLIPRRLRTELTGVILAKGPLLRDAPTAPRTGRTTRYASAALTIGF